MIDFKFLLNKFHPFRSLRYKVEGESMVPTLLSGQTIHIDRDAHHGRPITRFEIVIFQSPFLANKTFVKRIIGLPGEIVRIADGHVFINASLLPEPYVMEDNELDPKLDLEWEVGDNEYFTLGDNRKDSIDSRRLGPIRKTWINGVVED